MDKKLIYILITLICVSTVYSWDMAVRPASLDYGRMLRGGYAEKEISLITQEEIPLNVSFKLTKESNLTFFQFEPNLTSFTISRGNPQDISLIIEPNEDTPNGKYYMGLNFYVEPANEELDGQTASAVGIGVTVKVNVEISDYEIRSCEVRSFSIDDSILKSEKSNISGEIYNSGNVYLEPDLELLIKDSVNDEIIREQSIGISEINPTLTQTFTKVLPSLDMGQYMFEVEIPECEYSISKLIEVREEDEIISSGRIKSISLNPKKTILGNPIEILVDYLNDGQKTDDVKVRSAVYLNDQLVKILESDPIEVGKTENHEFSQYFTPSKEGIYRVVSKAYFGKKVTYEHSNTFKAFSENRKEELENYSKRSGENIGGIDDEDSEDSYFVMMMFSFAAILVLLILIRKKKSKNQF